MSVCETRNVQNGNCFGLVGDACVASVVDFGFWLILDCRTGADRRKDDKKSKNKEEQKKEKQ